MSKSKFRNVLSASILFVAVFCLYSCRDNSSPSEIILEKIIYKDRIDTVFVDIVQTKSLGQKVVDTAMTYLGAKEDNASNSGPIVDLFFQGCDIDPGHPWCACFVNYTLISVGGEGPSAPAWSPSWFPSKKTYWTRGYNDESETFRTGSSFGIYFNNLNRIGHVGLVSKDFGDGYVLTIEGNTNSAGSREGHGVYMRIRHKSTIYKVSDWL